MITILADEGLPPVRRSRSTVRKRGPSAGSSGSGGDDDEPWARAGLSLESDTKDRHGERPRGGHWKGHDAISESRGASREGRGPRRGNAKATRSCHGIPRKSGERGPKAT